MPPLKVKSPAIFDAPSSVRTPDDIESDPPWVSRLANTCPPETALVPPTITRCVLS